MQCVYVHVCVPHYAWNNSKPQLSLNVRAVSLNQWHPFLFQTSSATAWKSIYKWSPSFPVTNLSVVLKMCFLIQSRFLGNSSKSIKCSLSSRPVDNLQSPMLILNKCQLLSAICLLKPGPFPFQPTSSGGLEALSADKSA